MVTATEAANPATSDDILSAQYQRIRATSVALCRTLEAEDFVVQSMPDVSPDIHRPVSFYKMTSGPLTLSGYCRRRS